MEKKKPEIRFNGFEGEWAPYAFRFLFTEKRDTTQDEFEDQLLSCAIDGIYLNSELFNHFRGSTTIGYLKVKRYDLILSAQNLHLGNANVNLRFARGIISPAYKVYTINGDDPYFINAWVKSEHAKNFFMSATTEGASLCRKNIEWEFLYDKKICIPSLSEQEKIGVFLTTLDKLIAKLEAKLDKLRKLKQALLEKMFVNINRGYETPEIRFKGYTNKWEVNNVASIFETYYDKNHPNLPVLSATQEFGMVIRNNVGFQVQHNKENEVGYKRVLPGQFVIHLRSFQGGFAHSMVEGITSPAYTVMQFKKSTKQDDIYWKYVLTSKTFIKRLETVTYGIRDGRSISFEDFSELDFTYPSLSEQEQIGKCFTQIDTHFSKTSTKLTKLRNIKQSLLQKMFA